MVCTVVLATCPSVIIKQFTLTNKRGIQNLSEIDKNDEKKNWNWNNKNESETEIESEIDKNEI